MFLGGDELRFDGLSTGEITLKYDTAKKSSCPNCTAKVFITNTFDNYYGRQLRTKMIFFIIMTFFRELWLKKHKLCNIIEMSLVKVIILKEKVRI